MHSLPPLGQAEGDDPRRVRAGRWKMLAVLLVCAAPVIASYFTYYVVRPEGRRNFGELIDPQRPMPSWEVRDAKGAGAAAGAGPAPGGAADGAPLPLTQLRGQWLLVSVASGACEAACEQHLYLQRQLRESLGKDKDRLDWVWLVNDNAPVRAALQPALTEATVLRAEPTRLAQWLAPAQGRSLADHLYVVDPQGNWMMRFPAGLDREGAARAKRDLERLMRASASWDEAGRR